MLNKRAQSTLEYVIILSVIIGAIILFATTVFKGQLGAGLNRVGNEMGHAINKVNY